MFCVHTVKTFVSGAVESSFDSKSGRIENLQIGIHSFRVNMHHQNNGVEKTPASLFAEPFGIAPNVVSVLLSGRNAAGNF